jgi:Ca-activated chloride channel family protein
MAGAKLEQARRALLFCIENLNPGDRFEVIRFSSEVEPLFGKLTPADRSQRDRASEFVKSLKPLGGTAIDDALKAALELPRDENSARPMAVIFLTDGRPTVGVADNVRILQNVKDRNRDRYRIFCFGIGTDVNTHLLDGIAEQSRAVAQYVLPDEDIELKVSSFYSKIKDPVLANPVLRLKGGDIRLARQHPSNLPDVFRGDQIVVAGRYTGKGDALLELEGTVNGAKRKFTYELTFPGKREEDSFIARIWATRRIGFLLDEIRLRGENSELRDEVTQLARTYGVVTPYTAYLIVEDESRRNVPEGVRSLESLRRDTTARQQAAETYLDYQRQQSGPAAVAGARAGYALQSAVSPDAAATRNYDDYQKSMALSSRPASTNLARGSGVGTASTAPVAETRVAGGRTFYLNNGLWVDSLVQTAKSLGQPVVLKVGTDEYFELLRRHPEAAAWLAIGPKVSFVLDGKLFQTTD